MTAPSGNVCIKVDSPRKDCLLPQGPLESWGGIVCILIWMTRPQVHSEWSHVNLVVNVFWVGQGAPQGLFLWFPVESRCLNGIADQLVDSSVSSPAFSFSSPSIASCLWRLLGAVFSASSSALFRWQRVKFRLFQDWYERKLSLLTEIIYLRPYRPWLFCLPIFQPFSTSR